MPETNHRPATPYVGPIHCALHDGMKIKVSVKIERNQDQFQIYLQCGPSTAPTRSDVAFVFNPRFNQQQVVRNSLINGSWGAEELHGNFPFNKGFSYDINILVKSTGFKVSADSRHLFDFTHRVPIDRVSHLTVEGGVEIRKITYEPERHMKHSAIHHHIHNHGVGFDTHHGVDFDFDMHHHHQDFHDTGLDNMMTSMGGFFGGMFNKAKEQTKKASVSITGGNSSMSFEAGKQPTAPPSSSSVQYPGNPSYPQNNQSNPGNMPCPNTSSYPQGNPYPNTTSYPQGSPYQNTTSYPQGSPYPSNPVPSASNYPGSAGYPKNSPYPGNPAMPSNAGYPGNTSYSCNTAPGAPVSYPGTGPANMPIMNPPVPFKHNFGPLYAGKLIFVSGIIDPNPTRFHVNFVCAASGDTALTFDVRFNYGSDRQELVRNTQMGGAWGAEERQKTHFPFSPNSTVDIVVLVEPHCFKIAVNNQHLLEYNHMIQPLTRIDTLNVDGSIRINQVRFQ